MATSTEGTRRIGGRASSGGWNPDGLYSIVMGDPRGRVGQRGGTGLDHRPLEVPRAGIGHSVSTAFHQLMGPADASVALHLRSHIGGIPAALRSPGGFTSATGGNRKRQAQGTSSTWSRPLNHLPTIAGLASSNAQELIAWPPHWPLRPART